MTTAMTSPIWIGASQAAGSLGISISTIYRWRSSGLLKPGIHWRRKTPSTNSPERCNQAMATATTTGLDTVEPIWAVVKPALRSKS
jgi:hypothetical protein